MAQSVHSPLGASSAERWMNCPGSVTLIRELALPETDEPDYRTLGTHAHALAERCLTNGTECWEEAEWLAGLLEKPDDPAAGVVATSKAVQVFLDVVRALPSGQTFVEHSFTSAIHPLFFGTTDYGIIAGDTAYVNDYKHGEGIAVDVEENPQVRYYGFGLIQDHPEVERVIYRIVQPRGFHPDGPVREWEESAASLRAWVEEKLVPAMLRTELDDDLLPGDWCRFCPAKLVCPVLTSLFGAAAKANPKDIPNLSDEALGRSYQYIAGVKFYLKALESEAFARLNSGKDVPNTKLVKKKADRVWKSGADALFQERFGEKAFTKPELKTPAQMEQIDEAAKALVHEWGYTPDSGLTVALASDKRLGVKVKSTKEIFEAAVAALDNGG